MSQCVKLPAFNKGEKFTHFGCGDCGNVLNKERGKTLRPNNKFCDPVCHQYVLMINSGVEDLPPEPGDEIEALKMRVGSLEKLLLDLKIKYKDYINVNKET